MGQKLYKYKHMGNDDHVQNIYIQHRPINISRYGTDILCIPTNNGK